MKTTTATPWIQHPRFLKILYPTLVAVAMVLLWQGAVSYFRIPAFLVPSPLVMLESLWTISRRCCWRCCSPSRSP